MYGTKFVGTKAEETNDIIKILEKTLITLIIFKIRHKTTKLNDIQKKSQG